MRTVIFVLPITAIAIMAAGYPSAAIAGWYSNGILVNNMCRAPSGAWWQYPAKAAQPVGSPCTIPSTGEAGVVTAS
jgi:hypothetical protein